MADSAEERAKAWTSLFQILLDYSKSLILKKLKSKTQRGFLLWIYQKKF